jgi:hypothetical protein
MSRSPTVKTLQIAAVVLPALCATSWLDDEPQPPPAPRPPAHAIDVWMGHASAVGVDPEFAHQAEQQRRAVFGPGAAPRTETLAAAATGLGAGFQIVGSVAVLAGDETSTSGQPTRRGITPDNLAAVGHQFIQAFGDYFDQIAVFLAFNDNASPQSLAFQMPVKNDVMGIGLGLFDGSADYGSPSGRLQTMLNMKRILAYGRGAADDPDNDLYAVWAQEAAHRWVVYFRFRREGDAANSEALLGRQKAHWARNVQSDGSFMDGYRWIENGDGTFTPDERDKRYGTLDQYGMGLRTEQEVPPFFILEDVRQAVDNMPVTVGAVARNGRYKAQKTVVTVQDIVRAMGPRVPATDPAAADLRMGVVLLTTPESAPENVIGESFRIDGTRRLWDDYYNTAGDGRGKVCTQLLRPCRGLSVTFGEARVTAVAPGGSPPGPGQPFTVTVPVTNVGTAPGSPKIKVDGRGVLTFAKNTADLDLAQLAPGQTAMATFQGNAPAGTPCAQPIPIDLATVDTSARPSPSQGTATVVLGMLTRPPDDLEGASARTWKVNPDGTDTAQTGRWELGAPERNEGFGFVFQPGAAFSGQSAFVTGAALGTDPSANDVSGGLTTLESPAFSLDGLSRPHLSYQVYFVAADFQNEVLVPGSGDSLRVLASADGATWTEVDRLTGMSLGWQHRMVKLDLPPGTLSAPALRFRFVAEDADLNNVVEAVVDDVGLVGETAACSLPPADGGAGGAVASGPDPGCTCHLGSRGRPPSPGGMAWLAVTGLALLLRRRTHRR